MSSCSSSSPPVTPPSSDSEDDDLDFHSIQKCYSQDQRPSPHPLAASIKADRDPPSYQKRHAFTPVTPPNGNLVFAATCPPKSAHKPSKIMTPTHTRSHSIVDVEQNQWDAVLANAIDKAESKIDLSFSNLTYVPASIVDLKNLFTLPRRELFPSSENSRTFQRSTTAPASTGFLKSPSPISTLLPPPEIATPLTRPFARAQTTYKPSPITTYSSRGTQHNNLELYLMGNRINALPQELFELDRLVVLSLRGNKLTSLPPAIRRLRSLRELNIANNSIKFLPAEIQELQLNTLHLHPNPFEILPDMSTRLHDKRFLGDLKRGPIIPSLEEFVLRYLLGTENGQTRMEGELSLAEIHSLPVPEHVRSIFRASTGRYQARLSANYLAELDIRSKICPSSHHHKTAVSIEKVKNVRFHDDDPSDMGFVFNTPVEERLEWVGEVAGVTIGNTPKAFIPILWRGCSYGCLDFLKVAPSESDADAIMPSPMFPSAFGSTIDHDESNSEFQFSDSE
ncbi:hypothetical protein Clacol_005688 [Clathrus columnatus]|uniref:Uncharacterized protein n=1 Tax=Clathrus columnatus TaxID=1419009 RepID=A0AAV5AHP2_9AGAM|nr:hypothetical protein Clacol_005688 [Clathrus columnatus]